VIEVIKKQKYINAIQSTKDVYTDVFLCVHKRKRPIEDIVKAFEKLGGFVLLPQPTKEKREKEWCVVGGKTTHLREIYFILEKLFKQIEKNEGMIRPLLKHYGVEVVVVVEPSQNTFNACYLFPSFIESVA